MKKGTAKTVPIELLNEIVHYDPLLGTLKWKQRGAHLFKRKCDADKWNNQYADSAAFKTKGTNGYLYGLIYNKYFYAHRIAWAIHYGEWPENHIDHINGNKHDNRISNLRLATSSQNAMNCKVHRDSKTKAKGVIMVDGKFSAKIFVNGKGVHLGRFNSLEEASAAYKAASDKYHGEFGRHG